MKIIVTGAAGFIGSNMVKGLNARGIDDVIAVDNLGQGAKFKNLRDIEISDYIQKDKFIDRLERGEFGKVDAIIHEGACSDTMEHDGNYMIENNYSFSKRILDHCVKTDCKLLYASSAAVYGQSNNFSINQANELPLNVYGYSKLLFDRVVRTYLERSTVQIAGFRYFNVYGPGEAHKGRMSSVAFHHFNQMRHDGYVRLFGSYDGYAAGEQSRDFLYIDDLVSVKLWFLENPDQRGIFNLGTGVAEPFNAVALAVINEARAFSSQPPLSLAQAVAQNLVRYEDFPEALKGRYQSYTQADIGALRDAGYHGAFVRVAEGVRRYASARASMSG